MNREHAEYKHLLIKVKNNDYTLLFYLYFVYVIPHKTRQISRKFHFNIKRMVNNFCIGHGRTFIYCIYIVYVCTKIMMPSKTTQTLNVILYR